MGKHGTRGIVIAVAIGALSLAPSALGGNAGTSCLESAASSCQPVGARPGAAATSKAKQQRAKLQPRIVFQQGGEQIWRAGNHLMY